MGYNTKFSRILFYLIIFVYSSSAAPYPTIPTCVSNKNTVTAIEDINKVINELIIAKVEMQFEIVEVNIDDDQEPFDFDVNPKSDEMLNKLKALLEKIKNVYTLLHIADMYDVNIDIEKEKASIAFNSQLSVDSKKVEIMSWDNIVKKRLEMLFNTMNILCTYLKSAKEGKNVDMGTKTQSEKKFVTTTIITEMVTINEDFKKIIEFIRNSDCSVRYDAFNMLLQQSNIIKEHYTLLAYAIKDSLVGCKMTQSNEVSLKNNIPTCIQNAVFSNEVCIRNARRNEYLITDRYKGSQSAHLVFTWTPRQIVPQGKWKVVKNGNEESVYFTNSMYNNRLTSTSTIQGQKRRTHTDNYADSKTLWKIEPQGNDCYLRNMEFNEYLHSDQVNFCPERRHVATLISKSYDEFAKWHIVPC